MTHHIRSASRALTAALGAVLLIGLAACSTGAGTAESSSAAGGDYAELMAAATRPVPASYAGPTEPNPATPGTKIASIVCYSILDGCAIPGNTIEEIAPKIGWEARTFDGGGVPTQQNEQILNAISWGADVIVLIAVDPNSVQLGLAAAKDAGIRVVSCQNALSSPNPTLEPQPGTVWPEFDVSTDYATLGENLANWIIADSEGAANVGVFQDEEFNVLLVEMDGFQKAIAECDGCTTTETMYFTASQIGNGFGQQVVSFVRSNPEVKYLYIPYDPPAADAVNALQTAGLGTSVTIVSALGNAQNLEFIREGMVQKVDGAYDNVYMGYAVIDQVIRLLAGTELFEPIGEGMPQQVLWAENLGDAEGYWAAAFDYPGEFLKIWEN